MLKWLNNISIRAQILATTTLFVLLCCACAYVGYWGQSQVLEGAKRDNEFSQVAARALEIDRDVQKYKFRSDNFVYSGSQVHLDEANLIHENLTEGIKALQGWSSEGELTQILESMQIHLETVGHQLNVAKEERGIRERIVNLDLPASERQIVNAFTRSKSESENDDVTKILSDSQLAFETATKETLQYFIHPSTDTSLSINRAIRSAISELDRIQEPSTSNDSLRYLLLDHQRLCSRAVTATRSYLYYANVVLAGEVSEFLHYSARLRDFILQEQNKTHNIIQKQVSDSHARSLILTGVAISLSLILAGLFYRQILDPISHLTSTFRALAAGSSSVEIPCLELNNEIGKMANAASVFNDKNTETRKLLDQSEKLAEELRITNQELDNFAYVASHDLSSPLRGISNLAKWVQEDAEDCMPEDAKRNLKLMEQRVEVMDKLLSDLLEYSRIGRVAPEMELVDCQQLVEEIFAMAENESQVELRIARPLPTIRTVKTPLMQVFLNLITNGIKYNDKGDEGWVEVDFTIENGVLEFSVCDNGIGIDPMHFQRIFQMYQRVSHLKKQGSGMGLALVKKNVEIYGGKISVDSDLGLGSAFHFTWPSSEFPEDADAANIDNNESEKPCNDKGDQQCLTSC